MATVWCVKSSHEESALLTFHSHVHGLVMNATVAANELALALTRCVSHSSNDDADGFMNELIESRVAAGSLRSAVQDLLDVVPDEVVDQAKRDSKCRLFRHLEFIDYWLGKEEPGSCVHDPCQIAEEDLPRFQEMFDEWYLGRSPEVPVLHKRLFPLIAAGQLDSALRTTWAIFKTQMVETFGVPSDLDGHQLADALFGPQGATAKYLDNRNRQGFLNLFKGLYTLFRNDVIHNDVELAPDEIDGIILMVNSALLRLETARREHPDG